MKSAAQFTRDTIAAIKVSAPAITVSEFSTTTNIYSLIRPIAESVEVVGQDVEKALFSQSFLAATGKFLDNLLKEMNVKRLRNESDSSIKKNAGKIFTPGSTIATEIDPDEDAFDDEQLDHVSIKGFDQLYALMKSRFFRINGASDLPMIGSRYWAAAASLLADQYQYIDALLSNDTIEDSEDIGDTDWIYVFDALRVPGVKSAKVALSDYNEITIYLDIDERTGVDYRGRKLEFNPSSVIADVAKLASAHLPKKDMIPLVPPRLIVLEANIYGVPVTGVVHGTATKDAVYQAVDDYVWNNRLVGGGLSQAALTAAIAAVAGVTSASLGLPTDDLLIPGPYDVLKVGYVDIEVLP